MSRLIPIAAPLLAVLGLWDIAPFLWARAREDPQQALLHAVLALGLLLWWLPRKRLDHIDPLFWKISLGLLIFQGLTAPFIPLPLIRSMQAALSLAAGLLISLPQGRHSWPAILGSCLLLPFSEASAAFFLGYPARLLASGIAAMLLRISGSSVLQQGVVLSVQGEALFVDAPCAGLRMGWTGLAICALFCLYQQSSPRRSLICMLLAPILILLGNVLRMCSLAQLQQFPQLAEQPGLHNAVGLFSFVLLLPLLYALAGPARKEEAAPRTHQPQALPLLLCMGLVLFNPVFSLQGTAPDSHPINEVSWPEQLEGQILTPVPLTEIDQRFPKSFPGETARFKTEQKSILLRWVKGPTRLLHASATCYQAGGYDVSPLPAYQDEQGRLWSQYRVRYGHTDLVVREQVHSVSSGASWPEVTAWYWDALLKRDPGPWLAVTVAENWNARRENEEPGGAPPAPGPERP